MVELSPVILLDLLSTVKVPKAANYKGENFSSQLGQSALFDLVSVMAE